MIIPTRVLVTLTVLLLVSACTNSKLVISPLYNRLDDRIEGQFADLASFSDDQVDAAGRLIDTFHVWHRQSELPRYARFLGELSAAAQADGTPSQARIQAWFDTVETLANRARACHPVNFAAPLIRGFSDQQVAEARAQVFERRRENRQEYLEQTDDDRLARRAERFTDWAARIGVVLDADQRSLVRRTLTAQTSLRKQYFTLSDRWNRELFALLDERNSATFAARLQAHLDTQFTGLRTQYADEWQANRDLWQDFAGELAGSLNAEQRRNASRWLGKMGNTLAAVSRDEPSFRVSGDPAEGCQVSTGAADPAADGLQTRP